MNGKILLDTNIIIALFNKDAAVSSLTKLLLYEGVMDYDAKFVKPLLDYCIYVELEDGRKGVFDLKPYLGKGVLRELQDVHYFNQVGIVFGAVSWPNEQDIAPETLAAEMIPVEPSNSTLNKGQPAALNLHSGR